MFSGPIENFLIPCQNQEICRLHKSSDKRKKIETTFAHNCRVSEPSGPEIVFIIFSFSCEENWQILATHFHILWHNLPLKLNEVYGVTLHREMCLLCITMFHFYGAHLNFIFVFVEIASDLGFYTFLHYREKGVRASLWKSVFEHRTQILHIWEIHFTWLDSLQ